MLPSTPSPFLIQVYRALLRSSSGTCSIFLSSHPISTFKASVSFP